MSGFTRITKAKGIIHFLSLIARMRRLVEPIIAANNGELVIKEADNFYALFNTCGDAVKAGLEATAKCESFSREKDATDIVRIKVGLSKGFVLLGKKDGALYGEAADAATELAEELGHAGQMLIDESVLKEIEGKDEWSVAGEMSGGMRYWGQL